MSWDEIQVRFPFSSKSHFGFIVPRCVHSKNMNCVSDADLLSAGTFQTVQHTRLGPSIVECLDLN